MPMEQGYSAGEGFDKYSATRVRKSEKHSILLDIVLIRITKVMSTTLAQLYSLGLTFWKIRLVQVLSIIHFASR